MPPDPLVGRLLEATLHDGLVRFTVRPDSEPGVRTYVVTPEQAQEILTRCRLGSYVKISTAVVITPAAINEARVTPTRRACGDEFDGDGKPCVLPSGHAGKHNDADGGDWGCP